MSDSTMRKDKFMAQINFSHSQGGLTCSFNDYQLAEYIQHRRRTAGRLPVKHAVERVGPQADGSWVLGPSLFFNRQGTLLNPDESMYAWLGNVYEEPGIAHQSSACPIKLPLSIEPLRELYKWGRENMHQNFIPCMLLAGSCCMALHYKTILNRFLFCPIPIAYGKTSGTGKTTALSIGLSPLGAYLPALYQKLHMRSMLTCAPQAICHWVSMIQSQREQSVILLFLFLMEQREQQ